MITQVSATIELNPELANLAYEMGLNASKICENALKSAISRLQGVNLNKCLVDEAGFEPATSTMPTWRSCQTDLLAQSIWLLKVTHPRLISISYAVKRSTHKNMRLLVSLWRLWACLDFGYYNCGKIYITD